jgi:peptidoglycan/xylan/chitin deacetylase (PgdA/CDA1 family)
MSGVKPGLTEGAGGLYAATAGNSVGGSRPIGWNLMEPEAVPVLAEVTSEGLPTGKLQLASSEVIPLTRQRTANPGTIVSKVAERGLADYEVTNGGTSAISTTVSRDGSPTLTVTRATAGTSTVRINHTIEPVLDRTGRVGVWVYVPDYTKLTALVPKLALRDSTFDTGYFQTYMFSDADKSYNGWHFVAFSGNEWTGVWGTPNWAADPVCAIWFDVITSSANATVFFDQWQIGWTGAPQILITDDDGYANWFTRGLPVLDAYGLKSASSLIGGLIGTAPDWATMDMLQAAYANGHEHIVHGAAALSTLPSLEAIEADIRANRDFLIRNGFTKGSDFYVYPNGVYQRTPGDLGIRNILKNLGFKAARGTTSPRYFKTATGYGDSRWLLPIIGMDTTTSAATIKSRIDAGVANGDLMILMLHDIKLSGGSSVDVTIDRLDEVCKYISELIGQGKLQNVTPSQLFL